MRALHDNLIENRSAFNLQSLMAKVNATARGRAGNRGPDLRAARAEARSALRKEGFQPFIAAQAQPRDADCHGHTKHMLRLRRTDDIGAAEAAEVVIVNSHDGTSAYQMFAGMIRFVCTRCINTQGGDLSAIMARSGWAVEW